MLTIVIIAIGITALVGILTIVTAIDYNMNSSFASMGSNTFNINRYENATRRSGGKEVEKYLQSDAILTDFSFVFVNAFSPIYLQD